VAGNANRNVSVDITGDSTDLENAYDRSSKKSDDMAKKQDENNRKTESSFSKFTDAASSGFSSMFGMLSKLGASGYGTLALVAAGIAALGPASMLAAGAVTLGLGAALLGLGVIAASQSPVVRGEFARMWEGIKEDVIGISGPIQDALIQIPTYASYAFGLIKPELESAFAQIGPVFDRFVSNFARGFGELAPSIDPLTKGFSALLNEIGARMPNIFGSLSNTITTLADMAGKYSVEIAEFINGLFVIIDKSATVLSWFADTFWDAQSRIEGAVSGLTFGALHADLDLSNTKFLSLRDRLLETAEELKNNKVVMDDLTVSADALKLAIEGLNNEHLNGDMAASAYKAALDKATETVEKNRGAITWHTEEGRKNYDAVFALVGASNKLTIAKAEEGATVEELRGLYIRHREQLGDVARQMGMNEKDAKDLVDRYLTIPKEIDTKITADKSSAQNTFDEFVTLNSGRQIPVYLIAKQEMGAKDGGLIGYASGGPVRGPGGTRTDSIPARISRGEFVVNAAATRRNLPLLEAINSGRGVGGMGGNTTIYQINTTVAPTANLSAVGQEIVESIQAFESRSGKTWRSN
jgi:hypothetical protein